MPCYDFLKRKRPCSRDIHSRFPLVNSNATPGRIDQKKPPHCHKMDVTTLLCDSFVCRLCAEENQHGTNLFPTEDDDPDLSELVNRYLPIKASHPQCLSTSCCFHSYGIQLDFVCVCVVGNSKRLTLCKKRLRLLEIGI